MASILTAIYMPQHAPIGFFLFDRLFGTLALRQEPFNHNGYELA